MVAVKREELRQCLLLFTKFHSFLHFKVSSYEGLEIFRIKAQTHMYASCLLIPR